VQRTRSLSRPGIGGAVPRGRLARVLAVVVGGLALFALGPAAAAAANIGHDGPNYPAGTSGSPSGYKAESKVWFAQGRWFASIYRASTRQYEIYRLNAAQNWAPTGVVLDNRDSSRQDVYREGNSIWVASHIFQENPGAGTGPQPQPMTFARYTGTGNSYSPAAFTVNIHDDLRVETLVIDRGADNRFYATWVNNNQVNVSVSSGACTNAGNCNWATATTVDNDVSVDDISSLISFDNQAEIGIFWSDQSQPGNEAYRFCVFPCVSVQTVEQGSKMADDHLDLATDDQGRVYAAGKTKFFTESKPGTLLFVRSPVGNWKTHVVSPVADERTRPIVVVDDEHNVIHVFETGPHGGAPNGEAGGDIYEKSSRISPVSFSVSSARPVMRAENPNVLLNNPTSAKHNVNGATDLVVLASSQSASGNPKTYWHHFDNLTGGDTPPPPSGGGCTIRGTPGADVIDGTNRRDIICGRGGNDTIHSLGGRDRVVGGGGNDRIFGGGKSDVLVGGGGKDLLHGASGRDRYSGGAGRDTLRARDGLRELVRGGGGRDRGRLDRRDKRRSVEVLL
jgi:Ca2+-binding RTX toxin-like protein